MGNKNVAAIRRLVDELKYDDEHLVRDCVAGFRLVGDLDPCGVFPAAPAEEKGDAGRTYDDGQVGPARRGRAPSAYG